MAKIDPKVRTPDLTDDEILEHLKEIVRDGNNAAARIAAIRAWREIVSGAKPMPGGFDELDELAPRRGMRTKKQPGAA